jgi:hypothetical protein
MTNESEGLSKYDLFRFTPSKFLEQTVTGALLSITVLIISGYLVYHQVDEALGNGTQTEILFENLEMKDLLVTMDINLIHVPCEIVDLRFTSKRGSTHTLSRYHLQNAKRNKEHHIETLFQGNRPFDQIVAASKKDEGCKIKGQFHLHFLSNNFYVGYGNSILVSRIAQKNKNFKLSLEHVIHELSFGPNNSNEALSKKYDLSGFNTLGDHFGKEDRADGYGGPFYHSYYITAVPNVFDRMFGRILQTFQYTASAYAKRSMRSAIVFV